MPNQKGRRRRVDAKRVNGDALVIKSKYSDVLRAMRSDAKLVDLEANVRSIKRTRTGEMILEFKKSGGRGPCRMGRGGALTAKATLKFKSPNEVTEAEELFTAQRQQCEVQVDTAAVRLRKGPAGTRVAVVQIPVADVNKSVKVGEIKGLISRPS